eukprot:CAMPEP_0183376130 /NCGR_PEP_ID=MMETSP0164_2-20130417/119350_1 /TAXON_ID=221442 /ORGANISM="Coccolithus pelagicus ssp braarudi, Strain PLY182g" /LENGTH=193 /DNA_ID=CAMNT_0025553385 /DNA_START=72 /DNA_END=652 /DNA_ORIENTATION=-
MEHITGVASKLEYRKLLSGATFCLVLRGDNESSRKFTEVILAGCIPVLIADMPAWPFAARLNYREFTYEFHWRLAADDPLGVVTFLRSRPAAEVAAKRAALSRVRQHFYYHGDASRDGAVRSLLIDLCTRPSVAATASLSSMRNNDLLYYERLAGSSELCHQMQHAQAAGLLLDKAFTRHQAACSQYIASKSI